MKEKERIHKNVLRYYVSAGITVLAGIAAAAWNRYILAATFLALALIASIIAMRAQARLDSLCDHPDDEHTETYPNFERFMEHEAPNYKG